MRILEGASAERMSEYFVNYLLGYEGNGRRHIHRVTGWFGFVIRGVERAAGNNWWVGGGSEMRQLWFSHEGKTFKVNYEHRLRKGAARIGGLEVIEVGSGRGNPELRVIASIRNLEEAEDFYNQAPILFRKMVASTSAAA